MNIKRIVPDIPSIQIEKSKSFYIEFMGLKLEMDMGWILTFISKNNPMAQITLVKANSKKELCKNLMVSFEVEDVDKLYQLAIKSQIEIIYEIRNEPWGVRRFFVKDPNNVTINILSHA